MKLVLAFLLKLKNLFFFGAPFLELNFFLAGLCLQSKSQCFPLLQNLQGLTPFCSGVWPLDTTESSFGNIGLIVGLFPIKFLLTACVSPPPSPPHVFPFHYSSFF